MLAKVSLGLIKFYQRNLSPDHSRLAKFYPQGYCQFRPSCSNYAYQAIKRYGFILGWRLGLGRIVRCHPWQKGGYDPVPKK